jgi:D-glycero-D-manno-heptose 1,7-bisphosphate phosphatase
MTKLFLFDLDGTLISSYMEEQDKDFNTWRVLWGRKEYLQHILSKGHKIGIVTNQGAVAFGYVSKEQAEAKIKAVLVALDLPTDTPIYVCYADARSKDTRYSDPAQCARRKPSGAMIKEAMVDAGIEANDVIYVGDMESDMQAAADVGVRYVDADEFFSRPVAWEVRDGWAIRPSDGKRFSVEKTRTNRGHNLYSQLGGNEAAINEVTRRLSVRVVEAWGLLDDSSPWGIVETSLDGGDWQREASPNDDWEGGQYVLSGY